MSDLISRINFKVCYGSNTGASSDAQNNQNLKIIV